MVVVVNLLTEIMFGANIMMICFGFRSILGPTQQHKSSFISFGLLTWQINVSSIILTNHSSHKNHSSTKTDKETVLDFYSH